MFCPLDTAILPVRVAQPRIFKHFALFQRMPRGHAELFRFYYLITINVLYMHALIYLLINDDRRRLILKGLRFSNTVFSLHTLLISNNYFKALPTLHISDGFWINCTENFLPLRW